MKNRLLTGLVAAALAAMLAAAAPALARGGFGGGGHGGFGGGHFGGGGMHVGGIGAGMHVGGMSGAHVGAARFAGSPMAAHAAIGPRFASTPFATRTAFSPRFAGTSWHGRAFIGRHAFFFRHHRFHRFAFFGAPFVYANYYDDGCWRRRWTPYGWQWVNVCGDYW